MTTMHGFELIREMSIPELNSRARLFRHVKTGAELLSMENEDENKVFGITFRTPPPDSTGVPHIMEHSVLCGSRKYPAKEPFIELDKGSLKTFLNAFTYPDKTVYPVASANLKDFYNLVDVYLDAVFYPLITPYTLKQEGWHYEVEDPAQPLAYKGVVFNEMKGAYSSPESLLDTACQTSLFPRTPYGLDSGGDPRVIPDLTYEQFKRFHDTYYHPSNARIYFWGDDDPAERLRYIDSWLSDFERIPVESAIPLQPRFDRPARAEQGYDPGEDADPRSMVALNWMLAEAGEPELTIGLGILNHVLIGTPAAPLYKALIDSGLGEDLTGRGFDSDLRQFMFSVGLKGVKEEDAEAVMPLILDTLNDLAENGIDPETIAASLNTVEFSMREQNTGSFPRGLYNLLRALNTWLYDGDPLALLAFEQPLQSIKAKIAAGEPYFENLIREQLLRNPHRTTVILRPEPGYAARLEAEERARLNKARAGLGDAEMQSLVEETHELHRRQEAPDSPEALASIPVLSRTDLEPKVKTIPTVELQAGCAPLLFHDLFTNGIFYFDLGFDLHRLPAEYLPYVSIFSRALLETGTQHEDFVQLVQRIGRETGGIRPTTLTSAVQGSKQAVSWLMLRSKAMPEKAGELLAILRDVIAGARLDDRERIRQMVLEEKASLESALPEIGHRIVNTRLRSRFDEAGWINEQLGGVSQLFFLRDLVNRIENDWQAVLNNLETVRSLLFTRSGMIANVTIDAARWESLRPQVEEFLAGLPGEEVIPAVWDMGARPADEGLAVPAQVNFVGKGASLYETGYAQHGSALAIVPYLNTTYLWDRVRVQGGAYGGFAVFDRFSGVFTLLSYRDPNLVETLKIYDAAGKHLRGLDISAPELNKAIIGAIGDMDAYQLPDAKGYTALVRWLLGVSDEERQRLRDEVLGISPDDFRKFGQVVEQALQDGRVVVMAPGDRIEAANKVLDKPLEVKKVV